MVIIRVHVNSKNVLKNLARIEKGLSDKVAARSTYNAARLAKIIAKQLVPVDTGLTKRGIISVVKVKNKDYAEARVGFIKNPHPEKRYGGGEFNLPAWMTFSRKALGHPWRGGKNPRFLAIASAEAEKELKRQVTFNTGNLINV